jgi:spore maturation protein CgeB
MYLSMSSAKIVVNPATDIAGQERGNMRCWEALGCGSCMVASAGRYPEGFEAGVNFVAYQGTDDMLKKTRQLLQDEPLRRAIADAGHAMVRSVWSKDRQWADFERLAATL